MPDTDETRGLSQRELLLELRQDVKELRQHRLTEIDDLGRRPTRGEIYSALGAVSLLWGLMLRFI